MYRLKRHQRAKEVGMLRVMSMKSEPIELTTTARAVTCSFNLSPSTTYVVTDGNRYIDCMVLVTERWLAAVVDARFIFQRTYAAWSPDWTDSDCFSTESSGLAMYLLHSLLTYRAFDGADVQATAVDLQDQLKSNDEDSVEMKCLR